MELEQLIKDQKTSVKFLSNKIVESEKSEKEKTISIFELLDRYGVSHTEYDKLK
jgi:hypothetical protein